MYVYICCTKYIYTYSSYYNYITALLLTLCHYLPIPNRPAQQNNSKTQILERILNHTQKDPHQN